MQRVFHLLANATTTGASPVDRVVVLPGGAACTFQATVTGVTPSATVDIEAGCDGENWLTLGTITLDGTTPSDGFTSSLVWPYTRANVTALGDGCAVSAQMGV